MRKVRLPSWRQQPCSRAMMPRAPKGPVPPPLFFPLHGSTMLSLSSKSSFSHLPPSSFPSRFLPAVVVHLQRKPLCAAWLQLRPNNVAAGQVQHPPAHRHQPRRLGDPHRHLAPGQPHRHWDQPQRLPHPRDVVRALANVVLPRHRGQVRRRGRVCGPHGHPSAAQRSDACLCDVCGRSRRSDLPVQEVWASKRLRPRLPRALSHLKPQAAQGTAVFKIHNLTDALHRNF